MLSTFSAGYEIRLLLLLKVLDLLCVHSKQVTEETFSIITFTCIDYKWENLRVVWRNKNVIVHYSAGKVSKALIEVKCVS